MPDYTLGIFEGFNIRKSIINFDPKLKFGDQKLVKFDKHAAQFGHRDKALDQVENMTFRMLEI
ncbi:11836_t:CDS:2 [Gigaspora margarita]|uniref:11836_t:CDS:1 n=1 Tax=Gigaspora margarita TaxID=4874 RepID=A0ABN7WUY4_GIGMA|nr:11836_t:CDS:2 [Gigaspora margarita]